MRKCLYIIIGIIIGVVSSVSAVILYNASDIEFTPTDEDWNVTNTQDAINDLYDLSKNHSFEVIVSYTGQSGGPTNNAYTSKSYTLTDEILAKNYKYYLLTLNCLGGGNVSFSDYSKLTVHESAVKINHIYQDQTPQNSTKYSVVQVMDSYYLPAQTENIKVYDLTFRGAYSIELVGVK